MDFYQEKHGAVLVEVVDITRATMKEADEFLKILLNDITIGWRKIVIDMKDCEYVDSTFLGALVISLKRIASIGGDIKLVGFHEDVDSMFRLTRLNHVFKTFRTRDEAIKSFNKEDELEGNYDFRGSIFSPDTIIPFEKLKEISIRHALSITNGNIDQAAKKLQISKALIKEMMEKYNIDHKPDN